MSCANWLPAGVASSSSLSNERGLLCLPDDMLDCSSLWLWTFRLSLNADRSKVWTGALGSWVASTSLWLILHFCSTAKTWPMLRAYVVISNVISRNCSPVPWLLGSTQLSLIALKLLIPVTKLCFTKINLLRMVPGLYYSLNPIPWIHIYCKGVGYLSWSKSQEAC